MSIFVNRSILYLLFALPTMAFSATDSTFVKNAELELKQKFDSLNVVKSDQGQLSVNTHIVQLLSETMADPLSFTYPFDSLRNLGKITSPDKKIRIYTWNLPFEDGSHNLYGIVQFKAGKDSLGHILLNDQSWEIENAEFTKLTKNRWYGALYYQIIQEKVDKQTYYFLMGYNPWNLFSNKKVIDVFYFDEHNTPFFGHPFFKMKGKTQYRVIFEYNQRATMTLHYNEKEKMIVFHHLAPIDYKYRNNPAFYGPDFSFDAFTFDGSTWNFVENVDVRNPHY
jgi:hypothetical protein